MGHFKNIYKIKFKKNKIKIYTKIQESKLISALRNNNNDISDVSADVFPQATYNFNKEHSQSVVFKFHHESISYLNIFFP